MDFSPVRLTVQLDGADRVHRRTAAVQLHHRLAAQLMASVRGAATPHLRTARCAASEGSGRLPVLVRRCSCAKVSVPPLKRWPSDGPPHHRSLIVSRLDQSGQRLSYPPSPPNALHRARPSSAADASMPTQLPWIGSTALGAKSVGIPCDVGERRRRGAIVKRSPSSEIKAKSTHQARRRDAEAAEPFADFARRQAVDPGRRSVLRGRVEDPSRRPKAKQ